MRKTALAVCLILAILALSAMSASAQFGLRKALGSVGVSYALGDPGTARIEYSNQKLILDGLYAHDNDRDSTIYGAELGWRFSSEQYELGGNSFVVGAGYYQDNPDVGDDDSDIGFWAGIGDFGPSKRGLFYQFRYIFTGPLDGAQTILGWRF